jgi:diadenosine tetraphosphate (Ap4A) HIT family hydrolase
MAYDPTNVFARILRGELPCKRVWENDYCLAFHDIAPMAPVHVLVIPKGAYVDWDDFAERASDLEIAEYVRGVAQVARQLGLTKTGFRALTNNGRDAHQTVPHLHVHLFAGKKLGAMLPGGEAHQ